MNTLFKNAFFDRQKDVCDRTYLLLLLLSDAVSAVVITVYSVLHNGNAEALALYIVGFLSLITLTVRSFLAKELSVEPYIFSFLFNWVFLIYFFFATGGYKVDIPVYMISGFVVNAMILKGGMKYIFNAINCLVLLWSYLLIYIGVVDTDSINRTQAQTKMISLLIICIFIILIMLIFQTKIIRSEREYTINQIEKIEKKRVNQFSLFSSMSHEIRTPLNTIIGLTGDNLSFELEEEAHESLVRIKNRADKLLEIINSILDLSKIQAGKMGYLLAEYETGPMLFDALRRAEAKAHSKGLQFKAIVNPDIPRVLLGDGHIVGRIIDLVSDYSIGTTEAGGIYIVISTENKRTGGLILNIEIHDSGQGFRRENLEYAFKAFKRQDNTGLLDVTGLELALAKSFCTILGGVMTMSSIYGKGTSYNIAIPQTILNGRWENIEQKLTNNNRISMVRTEQVRALACDDESLNLHVLSAQLEGTGIELDTAASPEMAMELFAQKEYSLVFLDYEMPSMKGDELLKAFRADRGNGFVAIALTANADSTEKRRYLEMGFDGYLAKPVKKEVCMELLSKLLPEGQIKAIEWENNELSDETGISFERLSKKPIAIAMDSFGCIPGELPGAEEIKIIPFYTVTRDGKKYIDGAEGRTASILYALKHKQEEVFSLPASVDEYEDYFRTCLFGAEHLIYISAASKVSKGYQNAEIAARGFQNVTVVDSKQIAAGQGMIAYAAYKMAEAGFAKQEILQTLQLAEKESCYSFITMDATRMFLNKRISPFIYRLCREFDICPEMTIRKSRLAVSGYLRGSYADVYKAYIRRRLKGKGIFAGILIIVHTGISNNMLSLIEEECKKYVEFKHVFTMEASASVGCSAGVNSFGLAYFREGICSQIVDY